MAATPPSVLTSAESGLNTVWADTIGVLWRAASGTVDPWTEANIVSGAQQDITQALGTKATSDAVTAAQQGQADLIDGYLQSIGASPSQFGSGVLNSVTPSNVLNNLGLNPSGWSMSTLIVIALVAVAGLVFLLRK
jgi:hypothetical protein